MKNLQNLTKDELRQIGGTRLESKIIHSSAILPISSKEMLDNYFIYSQNKDANARAHLKCNPMDEEWKNTLRNNNTWWFEKPIDDKKLSELRNRLLNFLGESVCLAYIEEDIDDILNYGQFWLGHNAKMMRGEPCHCHSNACNLYEQNWDKTRICTGYALSEDGMWRQHSWLIWIKDRSNQIIETTVKRVAYYGFIMDEDQCEKFCEENW